MHFPRLPAISTFFQLRSSKRRIRKVTSTFIFHGLGLRSYSFRRAGGVRRLLAKRGLGLNSSSGLTHIPGSSSKERSTLHTKHIIQAGLFSSLFGASPFFSTQAKQSADGDMSYPVQKSEDEWRAVLSPEQFRILRAQGTEAPSTGEYDSHYPSNGVYNCAGCNTPLYKATTKFKSGCGWPAFYENLPGKVIRKEDSSLGRLRTEIVCANCGGHLGHVFKGERFPTPTDERHCVNSVSLKFVDGGGEDTAAAAAAAESKA